MPSVASLEDLQAVRTDLDVLKTNHPESYVEVAALFKKHRKVGYKNICKMLLDEATPEKLKELGLGKGKANYDKKKTIQKRDADRDMEREIKKYT